MINKLCPKCGSSRVQLSNEETHHHGFFWWLFFGWYAWSVYICCKWTIGLTVFLCWDIWAYIIDKIKGVGHVWQCRRFFSGKKRVYYCHDCGFNFRA